MDRKEKAALNTRINDALEELLIKIYAEQDIETGDLTPSQYVKWLMVCEDAVSLFVSLIMYNRSRTAKEKEEKSA